jgi:hypothetical protein
MSTDENNNEVNAQPIAEAGVTAEVNTNGIYGDAVNVPDVNAVTTTAVVNGAPVTAEPVIANIPAVSTNVSPVVAANSQPVTARPSHAPHPNDLRITRAQVDQVVDCIKNIVDGRKPNAGMIIRIVANCMSLTNKLKTNTATSKKLIINGIQEFIQSSDAGLSPEETEALMSLVDITVDDAFDTLKEVAKKDISVAKSCCVIV